MTDLATIARHLDGLLDTQSIPDYPGALNGVQLANRRPISRIAAAVDVSKRVIDGVIRAQANLLLVHHGMFWGGAQPVTGAHRAIKEVGVADVAEIRLRVRSQRGFGPMFELHLEHGSRHPAGANRA